MKRHVLSHVLSHIFILGLVGGVLIAILRWSEYQFLVIEHSLEIYGAIVAIIFVVFGIWLGIKLTKPREKIVLREVLVPTDVPAPLPSTSPNSTPSASPPASLKSSPSSLRASATARSPTASSSVRTPSKPTAAGPSTS
jgi:hypothetical protein